MQLQANVSGSLDSWLQSELLELDDSVKAVLCIVNVYT